MNLFRAYSTKSGAVFDKRTGFVARGVGIPFDPTFRPNEARDIITNHLDWHNIDIPSPLISTSISETKSEHIATALKKSHPDTKVYIAELVYGGKVGVKSEPVVCYNMCSVAEKLEAKIQNPSWRDSNEFVFVHSIPLSSVVKVREVVSWKSMDRPAEYVLHWSNCRNAVHEKYDELRSTKARNSENLV